MSEADPILERLSALPPGLRRQMEIYMLGLVGKTPGQSVDVDKLAHEAKSTLKAEAYDYLAGAAGGEETMRANREAFRRWRIVPRFLRDVSVRDLSVEILGQTFPVPFMLAPIGVQSILHTDAELAVARAARSVGVPLILSTVSSVPLEQIAAVMGDVPRWFQLYWPKSDELAASFLKRAETAGYGAIVVTLDTYLLSWRERDIQNAYLPFLTGEGLANYFTDPVFQKAIGCDPRANPTRAVEYWGQIFSDPSRTWAHLVRLREATSLPIVLKGVLHPDDARRAIDHGASGVIVSNHGGRQVDGAIAAIDALPAVVDAVGDRTTVLFDSGIRRGADVFKAIALGARCVLLGRPYCYGLAVRGEEGVLDVIRNLIADVDLTLGLAGCASCAEVSRANLAEPFPT
jgi:isopentenyl diphosphate isomerase/L-lactate dehydrogenase-like FMN-dependent dehydrogenase